MLFVIWYISCIFAILHQPQVFFVKLRILLTTLWFSRVSLTAIHKLLQKANWSYICTQLYCYAVCSILSALNFQLMESLYHRWFFSLYHSFTIATQSDDEAPLAVTYFKYNSKCWTVTLPSTCLWYIFLHAFGELALMKGNVDAVHICYFISILVHGGMYDIMRIDEESSLAFHCCFGYGSVCWFEICLCGFGKCKEPFSVALYFLPMTLILVG